MTLIAAYKSYGTPVLIGDFLTTGSGDRHGLRKKVLRLADNCVLAWTGHLVAANAVAASLKSALHGTAVTLASVRAILTDPATSKIGNFELSLIGWVVDREGSHCFRWNIGYPHEIFHGVPMYDGTGEGVARELIGEKGLHDASNPEGIDPNRAIGGVLTVTAQLMRSEMLGPTTKPLGFGFAYEILCLADGQRFEYVDSVLYLAITCELDEFGRYMRAGSSGSIYKCEVHDEITAVYVYDPKNKSQQRHVITSVGPNSDAAADDLLRRICSPEVQFPFASEHYCVFVNLVAPGLSCPPVVFILGKQPPLIDTSKPNAISLKVPREVIETIYRDIVKNRTNGAPGRQG